MVLLYWHISDIPALSRLEPDEQRRIISRYWNRAYENTFCGFCLLLFWAALQALQEVTYSDGLVGQFSWASPVGVSCHRFYGHFVPLYCETSTT
jgi:hypothetical protein